MEKAILESPPEQAKAKNGYMCLILQDYEPFVKCFGNVKFKVELLDFTYGDNYRVENVKDFNHVQVIETMTKFKTMFTLTYLGGKGSISVLKISRFFNPIHGEPELLVWISYQ